MKICLNCGEEFTDKVTKCLYCGGPVEIVSTPQQRALDESDKKGKSGKTWKDYKIPISAVITLVVGILFVILQMAGLNKSAEMVIDIKSPKVDAPAPAAISAPEPATAPATGTVPPPVSESAYSLMKNAFALCTSGKCTDAQKAIEYLNEAIKLKPDLAEAYNNRANAYTELKQYDRAIEDYNEAIRLKPNYAHAYYNRGSNYIDLKQYDRAIEDYNETIRLKPDETNAYVNRGNTYLTQGNKELGCSDAQKACELGNCKLLEDAKKKKNCL